MIANDFARNANNGGVRWNIVDDNRISANSSSIANCHCANYLGPGANKDVIAEHRALSALGSNGDLMFNSQICASADCAVNDYTKRVNQHESRSELCSTADDAAATKLVESIKIISKGAK